MNELIMRCHLQRQRCGALCESRSLSAPCSQLKGQTWRENRGAVRRRGNMRGKVNSNHGKLSEAALSRAEYSYNYTSKGIVNMKADNFLKSSE